VNHVQTTEQLQIDMLVPFANHPFALYEGKRLDDMVESVKANGVMVPIVVRPIADGKFEILSGHNRVNAAKEAGLTDVPAAVRTGLSDSDAMLIVTESNLLQRSFADLCHSERATVIAAHYGVIKGRGYRSDLVDEVDVMLSESVPNGTLPNSLRGLEKIYGVSKNTISRYLRIAKLIPELQRRIDDRRLTVNDGVELSYLSEAEQVIVEKSLAHPRYKMTAVAAKKLKAIHDMRQVTDEDVAEATYVGEAAYKPRTVKFRGDVFAKFFDDGVSQEDIADELMTALEFYRANANVGRSGSNVPPHDTEMEAQSYSDSA